MYVVCVLKKKKLLMRHLPAFSGMYMFTLLLRKSKHAHTYVREYMYHVYSKSNHEDVSIEICMCMRKQVNDFIYVHYT